MSDGADVFAQAIARMNNLLRQLAAAPLVDVMGVVRPTGPSGGRLGSDEPWILNCAFLAWRIPGSAVQTSSLDLRRVIDEAEFDSYRQVLKPYTVVRVKARVVADALAGGPAALLEEVVGVDHSDEDLNENSGELTKPVTFADPVLGTFTLDRRVDWFTAQTIWRGAVIALNLSATQPVELREALNVAHSLWENQEAWNQRIRDFAVQELLPLKNENWLDEVETIVTPEIFLARMVLKEITVNPDGSFSFWHDDGDLFAGHAIEVIGDLTNGPTDADIPG